MNSSVKNFCSRFSLRPFMFGITIGLGLGLATKNIGIGIAVGVAFAVSFGAFGRRTKCGKISTIARDTE